MMRTHIVSRHKRDPRHAGGLRMPLAAHEDPLSW